jgi:heme/copper-type cytochrome/quinol oxidase subunit 3
VIAAAQRRRTLRWVSVTFLLGLGFVAMKITEFYGTAAVAALAARQGNDYGG